ncbi:thiamine pyrophosphate-binding protein [Dechloromonas sp. ZY10]|uniref:thiamine pyrophosphate-binding protein n=1 Tax=Dechloromonas aquae TaxID=2664436 RepID=UPI003528FF39
MPMANISHAQTDMQIADLLVAYLEQIGVSHVFGVPGGAIEPLYNAIARSQRRGGIRPVVARHESGAAFMADAYTRETGKIGVCCATSGPGATNLITGVACAFDNCIPMLVITGQPSLPSFGRRALQESACTGVNTLGMFRHCTRYDSLISHPEQFETKLVTALQRAMRAPCGPVHLTIPLDIMKMPSPVPAPSYQLMDKLRGASLIDMDAVDRLCQLFATARTPCLLIGGSCSEAIGDILAFAHRFSVPYVTTPDGKGLIEPNDPLYRGVFGFAGHPAAGALLRDPSVDLVLAVGSSMNEWTSSGWSHSLLNDKLIHIDESAEHLARSPMARLHVRGRLQSIFSCLLRQAPQAIAPRPSDAAGIPTWKTESHQAVFSATSANLPDQIGPARLMHELGKCFPPHTRFLADAGNSVAWAIQHLMPGGYAEPDNLDQVSSTATTTPSVPGGWLRLTMDFAPMGWAIGGAIGTAIGNPEVPVVCLSGDGSMLMNGQEISVAVAEKLNVVFVVLNDQALGMVKHGQRLAGAERIAYELPPTDFAALAQAQGAHGITIRTPEDMASLDIPAILQRGGPCLLDVYIDPEAVPPINLRMQMLGGAL